MIDEAALDRAMRRWPALLKMARLYGVDGLLVSQVQHARPLILADYRQELRETTK